MKSGEVGYFRAGATAMATRISLVSQDQRRLLSKQKSRSWRRHSCLSRRRSGYCPNLFYRFEYCRGGGREFLGRERLQNIVGGWTIRIVVLDPDLDASELVCLECLKDGGDAPMAAGTAIHAAAYRAEWQVDIVEHENALGHTEVHRFG